MIAAETPSLEQFYGVRRIGRLFVTMTSTALVATAVLVVGELAFSVALLGAWLGTGLVWRAAPSGILSAAKLYWASAVVFGLGLYIPWKLGVTLPSAFATSRYWLESPATEFAAMWTGLGLLASSLGIAIVLRRPRIDEGQNRRTGSCRQPSIVGRETAARLAVLGLSASVLFWVGSLVAQGGAGVFFGTYANLRSETGGGNAWTYFLVAIFLCISMTGGRGTRRLAWIVFTAWALLAAPVGLRGEVLFPLAAGLAVRSPRLSAKRALLTGFVLLALVSLGREVRASGVAEFSSDQEAVSPVHGLMELGHSIRPLSTVRQWDQLGDPPLLGGSYLSPFYRPVALRSGLVSRPEDLDRYVMNLQVRQRAPRIGFSIAAEAYVNFREVGVVCVSFIVGLIVGHLDRMGRRGRYGALAGAILYPILVHIRNDFAFVPGQIAVAVALVLVTMKIGQLLEARPRNPDSPTFVRLRRGR